MKLSSIILFSAVGASNAFSVSNKNSPQKVVQKLTGGVVGLATALTISTNAASASLPMEYQPASFSSITLSKEIGDPFALPSYSESIKNKNIEIDLESVNKKIQDDAAARRDDKNVNAEANQRSIDIRKEEEEEEKRMARMREYAKREREEAIQREKAEIAANRWNTF
ncbi:hypothetical protein CTEN210_07257 [Chaetoceros tenuissimus]|uniref:PS II complex 12 kDa extrinsic protein n=1 Tax=Chaetoceros tenuissimus TaxID=426638 RepID=A0AAD3CT79_9STRA|nr:hypothetical protein CTEN210_07257 [Chaetoceros tenuissimus]